MQVTWPPALRSRSICANSSPSACASRQHASSTAGEFRHSKLLATLLLGHPLDRPGGAEGAVAYREHLQPLSLCDLLQADWQASRSSSACLPGAPRIKRHGRRPDGGPISAAWPQRP